MYAGENSGRELDLAEAWALTRALSPRDMVRVASIVAHDGTITNDYDHEWSVNAMPPSMPWAMYLSGDRRRYDYLVFDLDAGNGNAVGDAGKLSRWLGELRIGHLVAESGPTGGRHVWIALAEPTDAGVVKELSQLAKSLLPSLDVMPLQNPQSGCVRPPGAIHRYGGTSRPLGALSSLTVQQLDAAGVDALRTFLLDSGAELPAPTPTVSHGLTAGPDGHAYVPGDRRELTPNTTALLTAPMPFTEDASLRLVRVLDGMANAGWQFSDLASYVATSPAFEHVRTQRVRDSRQRRSAQQSDKILAREWRHAVEYVAARPANPQASTGSGYLERLTETLGAVQALQDRADTMPGLWGADRASQTARVQRGTYSRRAVLDALCLFMVQAASTTVEADCRRLAIHVGYGRTTVSKALRDLATPTIEGDPESAWIVREGVPERARGQRYRLSNRFSTGNHSRMWTQALPTPPHPLAHRDRMFRELGARLEVLCLDVFVAPHSLGRHAGNVYRHLRELTTDVPITGFEEEGAGVELGGLSGVWGTDVGALSVRTGLSPGQVRVELEKLQRVWLAIPINGGWARQSMNPKGMHALAVHLDVAGYLDDRAQRYRYEREQWGFWMAEVDEILKEKRRRGARPGSTAVELFNSDILRSRTPLYPRKPNGQWDHTTALRIVAARYIV